MRSTQFHMLASDVTVSLTPSSVVKDRKKLFVPRPVQFDTSQALQPHWYCSRSSLFVNKSYVLSKFLKNRYC